MGETRSMLLSPTVEICSLGSLQVREVWSALWHLREMMQSFHQVTPLHKDTGATDSDKLLHQQCRNQANREGGKITSGFDVGDALTVMRGVMGCR